MSLESMVLVVANEYTRSPGARYRSDGLYSGEDFRERLLLERFDRARTLGLVLTIDLDGTEGYATSFLEEAFGGLARARPNVRFREFLQFKSDEEPDLVDEIWEYMDDSSGASVRE